MSTAFITHPDCLKHDMGAGHPEQPARLTAIEDQLIASGIDSALERYEAPLATDEQLALVHPIEYVRAIREARGLTQEQVATRAGLALSDVGRIERGQRDPGVRVLVRIARGLGVPPTDFWRDVL